MNQFSISDIESLSGVKAHTIRIWEKRYGLLNPKRTETNIRYYNNDDLKTLLNVSLLNDHGHKISHISAMSVEQICKEVIQLEGNNTLPAKVINELVLAMVDMDSVGFEKLLDVHISKHGIENCVTEIFFPFLLKVGMMWRTSYLLPVQEHIISNIIRQKIIAALNNIPSIVDEKIRAILFLPPGEYHELGLLLVHFLLKNNRVPVLYLGADLPINDLEYVVEKCKPEFLYSHIVAASKIMANDDYQVKLTNLVSKLPLYISGNYSAEEHAIPQENFIFLPSYEAVKALIAKISPVA